MAGSSKKTMEESYANLYINDDDDAGLIFEEASVEALSTDVSYCLVGCFLTSRKINFQAMQDTLASIWRPVKGIFMEETNIPNLFMLKFFHELDMQRVLDDGPWTFNNQALMVKRSIGNYVGRYIQSDPKNFQSIWRQFLHIKVAINVLKPVKGQVRIKKSGGEWMWIKFKYERLPSFCFYCGIIGHTEKFCEALFDNTRENGSRKYDASLRAAVRSQGSAGKNQWL
ncbi:uncharacterized protein LOC141714835 [Apium graveolens]|uniref:uncharacterized protein LOC141714835 n=1 Tax=Apium graveolens TaxID=4045 RepID=UPI003D796AEF